MRSSAFAEPVSRLSRPRHSSGCRLARHGLALAALFASLIPAAAPAIEMFTFFGDGSRVPLPSLETPIEAYPGIPLRSDRLRARRRALRAGPDSEVRVGPPGGMSIRMMPPLSMPTNPDAELAPPAAEPVPAPAPVRRRFWRR